MIGAFISFIGFILAICWWMLAKQFRKYCKGEESMPVALFVIYSVLSILVLGFVIVVVLSWLPDVLPRPNNYEMSLVLQILIIISIIAIQCYKYVRVTKESKHSTAVENVDLCINLGQPMPALGVDKKEPMETQSEEKRSTVDNDGTILFCKYCGKRLDSDALFCPYCGKQLQNDSRKEVRVSKTDEISNPKENAECTCNTEEISQIKSRDARDSMQSSSEASAGKEIMGCLSFSLIAFVFVMVISNVNECFHSACSNAVHDTIDLDSINAPKDSVVLVDSCDLI